MYKLNRKSAAVKFYEWVWKTDVTKFKTLCPYFWKYVLTILFIPIILLCKGIYYILPRSEKVEKAFDYIEDSKVADVTRAIVKPSRFWDVVGKIFKWLFFIIIGVVLIVALIGLIIAFWSNPKEGFSIIGVIVFLIGIVVGLVYVFDEYELGRRIASPFKLFGTMISSLYHNLCPLITWK